MSQTVDYRVVFDACPKVSVQEFVPELVYEFPDAPEDMFPHFILRAINRLAWESSVLRREAVIYTQPCVENYKLEPPDCMDVVAVKKVSHVHGRYCCPQKVIRLTGPEPKRLSHDIETWLESIDVIHFHPVHPEDVFRVEMAVAPKYDACEIDQILRDRYYDTIMTGARMYLYDIMQQTLAEKASNRTLLASSRRQELQQAFQQGIRAATMDTLVGPQHGMRKARYARAW